MKTITKRINWMVLFSFTLVGILFFNLSCTNQKQTSINIALFKAPASDALVEMIPEFEKETGIKVNYEILPYADLKAKVEQQFFSKSGNYDVIMADCIWIPSFAERRYLAPLDTSAYHPNTYDFKDLLPALDDYLGRYPKGGTRYGMPFMSNTHMMTYRRSIVEPIAKKLGLKLPGDSPKEAWTWDQYYKVAEAITNKYKNSMNRIYGTSLQARAGAWLVYEWYSELFGFVNDPKARITGLPKFDESAAKAMAYYAKLYSVAPEEALTWGHEEETSAICSGKCAMDATSNVELAANLINNNCGKKGDLSFVYPPIGVSGIGSPDMGGYGLLLSAYSKNKKNASAFILWAASKEVHLRIVTKGGSPIRFSEIHDPQVLSKYPYLRFYDRLIHDSVYRARIPQWPQLQDVISRELTEVMKGNKSAEEATKAVADWIKTNLNK